MLNYLKTRLDYNKDTGVFTYLKTRCKSKVGTVAGSANSKGYLLVKIDGISIKLHHLAWAYSFGEFPSKTIDHINGIPSDNRIENLREVTSRINSENQRRPHSNNKSGFLGVSKAGNKYKAQIKVDGKKIYLGSADTPDDAYEIYIKAKRDLHSGCVI